jgi:hypothetical protein
MTPHLIDIQEAEDYYLLVIITMTTMMYQTCRHFIQPVILTPMGVTCQG